MLQLRVQGSQRLAYLEAFRLQPAWLQLLLVPFQKAQGAASAAATACMDKLSLAIACLRGDTWARQGGGGEWPTD